MQYGIVPYQLHHVISAKKSEQLWGRIFLLVPMQKKLLKSVAFFRFGEHLRTIPVKQDRKCGLLDFRTICKQDDVAP
jgi:hypothetical protein